MINDSHKPDIIIKMKFWRLEFKLVVLDFGAFNFINNFFFKIIEINTIITDILLLGLDWLIINTFLMIPLETTLALYHIPSTIIETVTIYR
jgi:hypothetical protein